MDFHRRPLPDDLVAFSSDRGRAMLREAMDEGTAEAWFPLAEQFHTQADPATCGLGSLVVVLNALDIDPGRPWKGPWRWFSEDQLDCCVPLDVVRQRGTALHELACLASCNGAEVEVSRATEHGVDAFRDALLASVRSRSGPFVIAAYDRRALGQTGAGHYSPIGAVHRASDHALVLDVARFKYPPHWAPIARLHAGMATIDPDTGRSRGWIRLDRAPAPGPALLRLTLGPDGLGAARAALDRVRAAGPVDRAAVLEALAADHTLVPRVEDADPALIDALRGTAAWAAVADRVDAAQAPAAALLVLAVGEEAAPEALRGEVAAVRRQLDRLCRAAG